MFFFAFLHQHDMWQKSSRTYGTPLTSRNISTIIGSHQIDWNSWCENFYIIPNFHELCCFVLFSVWFSTVPKNFILGRILFCSRSKSLLCISNSSFCFKSIFFFFPYLIQLYVVVSNSLLRIKCLRKVCFYIKFSREICVEHKFWRYRRQRPSKRQQRKKVIPGGEVIYLKVVTLRSV